MNISEIIVCLAAKNILCIFLILLMNCASMRRHIFQIIHVYSHGKDCACALLRCAYDCKPTDDVPFFRHLILSSHVCKGVVQHEEMNGRMTVQIVLGMACIIHFLHGFNYCFFLCYKKAEQFSYNNLVVNNQTQKEFVKKKILRKRKSIKSTIVNLLKVNSFFWK